MTQRYDVKSSRILSTISDSSIPPCCPCLLRFLVLLFLIFLVEGDVSILMAKVESLNVPG